MVGADGFATIGFDGSIGARGELVDDIYQLR